MARERKEAEALRALAKAKSAPDTAEVEEVVPNEPAQDNTAKVAPVVEPSTLAEKLAEPKTMPAGPGDVKADTKEKSADNEKAE